MVPPLSEMDAYPNVRAEIGDFLASLPEGAQRSLPEMTLVLIGPEVLLGDQHEQLLNTIEKAGFLFVDYQLARISEEQLERLYKYHVPDVVRSVPFFRQADQDYLHLLKTVPVRHWRLLRRRFALGPALILLVRKAGAQAAPEFLDLKGTSDPAQSSPDSLRALTDNPCFCRLHSSDDNVSFLRESRIFLSEARLRNALSGSAPFPARRLIQILDAHVPDYREFRAPVIYLQIQLRFLLRAKEELTTLEELYRRYLEEMQTFVRGIQLLHSFSECLAAVRRHFAEHPPTSEMTRLLFYLADPALVRTSGSLPESPTFQACFISEQERLLFETAVGYYRDLAKADVG